jgi:hypothetical protein
MSGAGVVFDALVYFFCEGITDQSLALSWWDLARAHGLTLVAIRQSRRIADPHMLTQIELTLLRVRVFVRGRERDYARYSARLAMSYVRLMIRHEDIGRAAASVMAMPAPDRRIGETPETVALANYLAETEFRRAVRNGYVVMMFDPEHRTEDDLVDGADAAVVPDDAEAGPDDGALFEDVFEEVREADEDEDIRFMDGSPLLDVVRF